MTDKHITNDACGVQALSAAQAWQQGSIVTMNQDPYPALGEWFVQFWEGDDVAARVYGNDRDTLSRRCAMLAASPTPPAEQQAQQASYVHPVSGMTPDELWLECGRLRVQLRDCVDRTHALRMQAAPKAAESIAEWAMRATPAEFNAANWRVMHEGLLRARKELESTGVTHSWIGPYIEIAKQEAQSAPKAAPSEGDWISADDVQRLVRELDVALNGEESAAPQASLCDIVGQVVHAAKVLGRPVLVAQKAAPARRVGTIALIGNGSTTLISAIASVLAAPQQEAQEPVAWQGVHDQTDLYYTKPVQADVRPLYTAPQPAPATPDGDELRKIARAARTSASDDASPTEYVLAGWRAALAAQGGRNA